MRTSGADGLTARFNGRVFHAKAGHNLNEVIEELFRIEAGREFEIVA